MKVKCILFLCLSIFSFAQVQYQKIVLGPGWATDINNNNQIVGYGGEGMPSWLWEDGQFTELEFPGYSHKPVAINDSGQILASTIFTEGGLHGLLLDNGILTDLGYDSCSVEDINNEGTIVGRTVADQAFFIKDGVFKQLQWPYSNRYYAYGINDAGTIIGWDFDNVIVWEDEVPAALPGPGDYALAINEIGQIVGITETGNACLWEKDESGQYQFYALEAYKNLSTDALDINNYGQIVGFTHDGNMRALTWINGEVIDLGYGFAEDINDTGWIVGGDGMGTLYLWKPVPEPATLLFFAIGGIYINRRNKKL